MAKKARRFYQVEFRKRPAFFEDIGNLLRISGLLLQGEDVNIRVVLPTYDMKPLATYVVEPTPGEWSEILQASDDPRFYDEIGKAWHRKVRYAISGAIQQKVWVRDGCRCAFCERPMGEVSLSVDHWIPLERGGANDTTNYITACRQCNKRKGHMLPETFCVNYGYDFGKIQAMVDTPLP